MKNKNTYEQFKSQSSRSAQGQNQKYSEQAMSQPTDFNISNIKNNKMEKKQWCRNFYMLFMTVIFMTLILIMFALLVFIQNQNTKVKDQMYNWMKQSLSQNDLKKKMIELNTAISKKDIEQKNQFIQILQKLDQQVKNNKKLADQLVFLKNDYKQISQNMNKNQISSQNSKEMKDLINQFKSLSSSFNNFQMKINSEKNLSKQQNKVDPSQKKIMGNQSINDPKLQINPLASLNPLNCTPLFTYTYIWIGDMSKMPIKYKKRLVEANYPYHLLGIREYQRYEKSYKLSVQIGNVSKSDLLRVSWLEQFGGIYSDLDVDIDYCCIQELIGDKKGLMFPQGISNAFMISTQPGSQFFRSLVKDVNLRQNNTVVTFMGPRNYDNWNKSQVTAVIDFGKCLNHTLDFTWRDEKNKW